MHNYLKLAIFQNLGLGEFALAYPSASNLLTLFYIRKWEVFEDFTFRSGKFLRILHSEVVSYLRLMLLVTV